MTAITARVPSGRYRFRHVARMEWIKLRSLRSTWWTLVITVAGAIAIGVTVGINTRNANSDLTNNALAGIIPALLLTSVLGVLTMTSEYSSGLIRSTLAAAPSRWRLLAAKAAVFGGMALVVGEAAAKHSHADRVTVELTEREAVLVLRVSDDGAGGADPARGSGLSGLAQRVRTVDGRMEVVSPPGGPTRVTVTLPMRA